MPGIDAKSDAMYELVDEGSGVEQLATGFTFTEGPIWHPTEHVLYFSDMPADIRRKVTLDGTVTEVRNPSFKCNGMTLDSEGNLYLTGKGVMVFNRAGEQVDHIEVPESWTANVCFGGKDRQTLFITASKGFYSIKMRVKGSNVSK